jgi:hypothetical protein
MARGAVRRSSLVPVAACSALRGAVAGVPRAVDLEARGGARLRAEGRAGVRRREVDRRRVVFIGQGLKSEICL